MGVDLYKCQEDRKGKPKPNKTCQYRKTDRQGVGRGRLPGPGLPFHAGGKGLVSGQREAVLHGKDTVFAQPGRRQW